METYLSFDVAYKSTAWIHLSISNDFSAVLAVAETIDPTSHESVLAGLTAVNELLDKMLIFYSGAVVDFLPGKKVVDVPEMDRTRAVRGGLDAHEVQPAAGLHVLIEHQPATINSKSSALSQQLAYKYAECDTYLVSPRLKGKLCFAPGLELDGFKGRYSTEYAARKSHSKTNFLHFIKLFHLERALTGIKKANMDDYADAFMQIIAYRRYVRSS